MTSQLHKPKRSQKSLQLAAFAYGAATVLLFYTAASPLLDEDEAEAKVPRAPANDREEVVIDRAPIVPRPVTAPAAPAEGPIEAEPSRTTEASPQVPTTPEEEAAKLDRKLAADGPPDKMMVDTQNAFTSLFTKRIVPGAELESIECRATVCRAKVGFATAEDDMTFFRHAIMIPETRMDTSLSVMVPLRTRDVEGGMSTTVYIYKADPPPSDPDQGG